MQTAYRLPSAFTPPSDPAARRAWLDEREATLAALMRDRITGVVVGAYDAFLDTLEASTLTAAGDMAAFDLIPMQWRNIIVGEIGPFLQGMYLAGGLDVWIGSPVVTLIEETQALTWARIVNQDALTYLETATNRITGIGDAVWNQVRTDVAKAIESGASNEQLKAQVQEVTRLSEFRADAIARTETNAAYNTGTFEGAEALGDYGPVFKEWSATFGPRTRETHAAASGQIVPFDEPFDVGGADLMYPLDDSGPAEEVVNCRCAMLLYYAGDTLPDGRVIADDGTIEGEDVPRGPAPRDFYGDA